jgi:hypothetical protein
VNSVCGVYVGSVPHEGDCYADDGPIVCLYRKPPQGFVLCRACERMSTKKKGWGRLFSFLFHNRRGFRSAFRSFGRCT